MVISARGGCVTLTFGRGGCVTLTWQHHPHVPTVHMHMRTHMDAPRGAALVRLYSAPLCTQLSTLSCRSGGRVEGRRGLRGGYLLPRGRCYLEGDAISREMLLEGEVLEGRRHFAAPSSRPRDRTEIEAAGTCTCVHRAHRCVHVTPTHRHRRASVPRAALAIGIACACAASSVRCGAYVRVCVYVRARAVFH